MSTQNTIQNTRLFYGYVNPKFPTVSLADFGLAKAARPVLYRQREIERKRKARAEAKAKREAERAQVEAQARLTLTLSDGKVIRPIK